MHRRMRAAMLTSLALLVMAVSAPSAFAEDPIQLSLGDSWGFGVGAAVPSEGGYVPQLNALLKDGFDCSPSDNPKPGEGCKKLGLTNLSVGGATTPSMIAGQLPQATQILQDRNGNSNPRDNVEVVTVSIGGNDVFQPIVGACLGGVTAGCVGTILTELSIYGSDLGQALSALRGAAGPDARIVLGTYDNAIVGTCALAGVPGATQLGALALEGTPFVPPLNNGLHDVMRAVAPTYDVEIAESFGDLDPNADWVGGADCLHPDDSGYAKVAQNFADVLIP